MSVKNKKSLSAKGLHKQYGSRMVVNNVDISDYQVLETQNNINLLMKKLYLKELSEE